MSLALCCINPKNKELNKEKHLEKQLKRQSKQIDRELRKSGKIQRATIKLLLLGTGESGKSTILKQMRIIHTMTKFSLEERLEKIFYIKSNLKDSFLSILDAMERFSIRFESYHEIELNEIKDFVYDNIDLILVKHANKNNNEKIVTKLWDNITCLWHDAGFKACVKLGFKYHLIDSCEYFFNRLDIIRKQEYLPSDQDILRCRILTTGIVETHFSINNVKFQVFDVGGQRDQRRKWIQCFNEVTAIIFVADLSSFDMNLREDSNVNRMQESLQSFAQIWKNRYLQNISVILFLNKYDILVKKLVEDNCKLENYFPSFEQYAMPVAVDESFYVLNEHPLVTKAKMFILEQFLLIAYNSSNGGVCNGSIGGDVNADKNEKDKFLDSKFCIPYFTCAVDTDNIKRVFKACGHILKREHLEKIGLI